jgi:hypothetical protein
MNIPENAFIKRAKHLGDYRIRFEFTDGHANEIDFHGFLTKPAQNPMATQFLDITRFKKFKIDQRADIIWGDWEMCFPFAALYAGDLDVDSLGNKKKVSRKPLRKVGPPTRSGPSGQKRRSGPKTTRVRVKA